VEEGFAGKHHPTLIESSSLPLVFLLPLGGKNPAALALALAVASAVDDGVKSRGES
jgi:hypothetical protein